MAIDSTMFGAEIPAGTYSKGDTIELGCIAGPAVVRSGRGAAILKRLTVGIIGAVSGSFSSWRITVKNSDWIDPMGSVTASIRNTTALDDMSGCVQRGNDCPLTPNSSWQVIATCTATATTTVSNSMFALIDIDYPSVSSITDPDRLVGIPTSIEYETPAAIALNALGTITTSNWTVYNEDIFKAGYEYALQKIEATGATMQGFIALANAAGMGGLQRIIPISADPSNVKIKTEYATKLQKGPMDIKFLMFANSGTASTSTVDVIFDFVKRRLA